MARSRHDPDCMTLQEHLQTAHELTAIRDYLDRHMRHRSQRDRGTYGKIGRGLRTKLEAARAAIRQLSCAFEDELKEKLKPLRKKDGLPDPWQLAGLVYSPRGHFTLTATRTPLADVPRIPHFRIGDDGKISKVVIPEEAFLYLLVDEAEDFAVEETLEDLAL